MDRLVFTSAFYSGTLSILFGFFFLFSSSGNDVSLGRCMYVHGAVFKHPHQSGRRPHAEREGGAKETDGHGKEEKQKRKHRALSC